jgi:predicted site-specific integrase-resolvase
MLNAETKYIRASEAAEILRVDPVTIQRWVKKGRIKDAYKINPDISNSPLFVAQHEIERILKLRQGEG